MADEEEFLEVDLPPNPHQIHWHAPGDRSYFAGIDRGVLYTESSPGVPWNGLISVDENSVGGDIVPFYIDGVRRRNDHYLEEFSAKISAFSSPPEFRVCDGEKELAPGLYVAQQNREPFDFSYRTFVGNDVGGVYANYELHLVYQATTEPSSRTFSSIGDNPEAEVLTWEIATLPIDIQEAKPSAHIKLDTRRVEKSKLDIIEGILYGYEEPPRMPDLEEIFNILTLIEEVEDEEDIPWEPDP